MTMQNTEFESGVTETHTPPLSKAPAVHIVSGNDSHSNSHSNVGTLPPQLYNDIYDRANQSITRGVLTMDDSYEDAFFFTLKDPSFKFASLHHLFSCIRDTISDTSYGKNLPIRNSSRYDGVGSSLAGVRGGAGAGAGLGSSGKQGKQRKGGSGVRIPCIQDVDRKHILVDPLIAYRNPVVDLYAGKKIGIFAYPSEEWFFAPLRKHLTSMANSNVSPSAPAEVSSQVS